MINTTQLIISLIASYLLGSIPFGLWLGKLLKGIDVREHGSHNIGASNTMRILGKPIGIATLILDIGKGWLAVKLAQWLFGINTPWALVLVGLVAVMGHIFPIYLKFKGGKGVATTFGIFLAITPLATLYTMLAFVIIVAITRYMSVGSIVAAICFPIFIYFTGKNPIYLTLAVILGFFIIIRHISNIKRLIAGTENKFEWKKKDRE
jgi:acyl phosphate:glycerol-3-phosphate acyltransferase